MPVVGRTPAHGVPGPPGGWATGKLTGAAGGWELIGLKPGALTGNRGGTGGALSPEPMKAKTRWANVQPL